MDMLKGTTPQSLSFLKRSGATGSMGSSSCNNDESSLGNPLIFDTILDEEVRTPILLATEQSVSVNGSIPSEKQCSFTQALINGNCFSFITFSFIIICQFSAPLVLDRCFCWCRNQCFVWHRTPYNSLCSERRRVV